MQDFKFETGLKAGHNLEEWKPEFIPAGLDGYKSRGTYFCLYLTGESGNRYHSQRAFQDTAPDKSTVYMFARIRDGDRSGWPDDIWPEYKRSRHEPFEYADHGDRLVWSTPNCPKVEVREDGWDWVDAGGHWQMSTKPLGDGGYYFHVPVQEGFDIPHYHQGQCYWAEGTINGEKVRGYGYLERAWSTGGLDIPFVRLPLVRKMNKLWMHFYASFEDGSYVTGCARKGRLGVNWSMAYMVNDGSAKVISPVAVDVTYGDDGLVKHVRLNTGEQVLEFEHDAVLYNPIHTVGRMKRVIDREGSLVRDRGAIVDSWTVAEWWPDNAAEVIDWAIEEAAKGNSSRLEAYGKLPIMGEFMAVPEK